MTDAEKQKQFFKDFSFERFTELNVVVSYLDRDFGKFNDALEELGEEFKIVKEENLRLKRENAEIMTQMSKLQEYCLEAIKECHES